MNRSKDLTEADAAAVRLADPPSPERINPTFDIDSHQLRDARFRSDDLCVGAGAMDIVERWFFVAAATSFLVLIGLGFVSL